MKSRIVLTAVLVSTLATAGCATFPGGQTLPSDLFTAARESDAAPDGFNDRLPRASCGEVTLTQGEQIPAEALECLDSAIGIADAELAVVSLTTEGDPIVTFYRTAADTPGIEIFIDGEFDSYGPKTWTHENCPDQTTFTSTQGCSTG